jgi:hypothetical protein
MKTRNTLAKRIAAATSDTEKSELSIFGRTLSPLERRIRNYRNHLTGEDWLIRETLEAIQKGDLNFLRGVADAVEILSKTTGDNDLLSQVLAMKHIWLIAGKSVTIQHVAELLEYRGDYSNLRKILKQNHVPIKPKNSP